MKRFLVKTIMMVIPIISVVLYYVIAIEPHRNGDLGKLGFIAFNDDYNSFIAKEELDSLYVINIDKLEQIDCDSAILTIGDSFSQQGKAGYQNYLSDLYPGWKIYNLNLKDGYNDMIQLFVDWLIEDKTLPPIVIVESVERYLSGRLTSLDFSGAHKVLEKNDVVEPIQQDSIGGFKKYIKQFKIYKLAKSLKEDFLNTQEYVKKHLYIDNPVKHLRLKQNLFSCKGSENDLYFYHEDLISVTEDNYLAGQQKLDSLLSITEQKGICFLFLVASDKYDLYKDFTCNDNYNVEGQLSYYKKYNNKNNFLNCKELLYSHLENGEKDVYRCNDTHWSPLAAMYVANEIKRRLDLQILTRKTKRSTIPQE